MPRTAFELAASRPWLMTGDALDSLMAVADRQGDVQALEARLGRSLDNTRNVTVRDGPSFAMRIFSPRSAVPPVRRC